MLVGKVTADGAPLAGAVISVRRGDDVADAVTDARGGFDLAVPTGTYELTVGADGYLPDYRARVRTGEPIELALVRGGWRVTGTVRDRDGAPIAGARVYTPDVVAFTDRDGRYALSHPSGKLAVTISHDAYVTKRRTVAIFGDVDASFVLERAAQLHGVVRTPDGRPIAGAVISGARERYPGAFLHVGTADDQGEFVSRGLAPGAFQLLAYGPGHASPQRHEVIALADRAVEVELVVAPAFSVRGRVVDPRGAPIEDADVSVHAVRGMGERRYTMTDAAGGFAVHGVFPGPVAVNVKVGSIGASIDEQLVDRDLDLTIALGEIHTISGRLEPPGAGDIRCDNLFERVGRDGRFQLRGVRSRELRARTVDGLGMIEAGTDEAVVPIDAGMAVEGVVVDEAGAPVAGEVAAAYAVTGGYPKVAISGADGRFRISGMAPGAASVGLEGHGGWLEIDPGEHARLVVRRETGVLRGVVRDERGEPVEGASVTLFRSTVTTDATGAFEFTALSPGEHHVEARSLLGDAFARVRAALGEAPTLVLVPMGGIEGRVTFDGAPVTSFRISGTLASSGQWFSSPDGAFSRLRLEPGYRSFVVQSDHGSAVLTLDIGREVVRRDIAIPLSQTARGVAVSLFDGTPLAGVHVHAELIPNAQTVTDAAGRFELHHVPPGCELSFGDEDGFLGLVPAASELAEVRLAPLGRPHGTIGVNSGIVSDIRDGRLEWVEEPAASAGIQIGDRLVALDGFPIPRRLAAVVLLSSLVAGRTYALTFERGVTITVTAV